MKWMKLFKFPKRNHSKSICKRLNLYFLNQSGKCPIAEMVSRENVLSGKMSSHETFCQGNVRSENCPVGELSEYREIDTENN